MRWLILYKTESTIFNVILSEPKMNILINNLFIFIEIFKCNLHFIIFHMLSIESLSLHFPTRDILWVIPTCLTLSLNKRFCFKIRKRYFYLFTKNRDILHFFEQFSKNVWYTWYLKNGNVILCNRNTILERGIYLWKKFKITLYKRKV